MFSERLTRSSSQKLRKKSHSHSHSRGGGFEEEDIDGDGEKWKALRCLSLYGLGGGGCKVGADTDTTGEESSGDLRRRSSAGSHEVKAAAGPGYRSICGAHGVNNRFWKRHVNNRSETVENPPMMDSFFLPDDILEMCLARLPLTALATARLVCKKWNRLTTAARFLEMRREGRYRNNNTWIFIFGAVKDGFCSGEIHALDVSMEKWHRIDSGLIRGRFGFSVATAREEVFVVGGCSSLSSFGRVDRSSFKTHKGVISFSPLGRSWKKVSPMKHARSAPVLAVFELPRDFVLGAHSHQARRPRARLAASDVYGDPHRLSLRRHDDPSSPPLPTTSRKSSHRSSSSSSRVTGKSSGKRFLLISVGGRGSWDEPLDSGEIYDSASNKWTEIQRVPVDLGSVCSGAVCNGVFYAYSETDKLAGYDLEKGFWVRVQTRDPSPPRVLEYHPKLVACDDRLFMLSVSWCEGDGQIGRRNKAVRKLWELDFELGLDCPDWAEVSVHPDAPMDWNAAFVADRGSIFGVEMFKIFGQVLDFLTVCDVVSARRGIKWRHVSRNRVGHGHDFDASSCVTKSMAVLHL